MLSLLNGVEEILSVPVWILRGHLSSFVIGEGLASLIGFQVDLDVVECAIWLGEFVGLKYTYISRRFV